jgi:DNA-binding XRE family transcriptional regulator
MTATELKNARRELGLNKAEIAARLRVHYQAYVKWERGERPISGLLETAIELLLEKDRRLMAKVRGESE